MKTEYHPIKSKTVTNFITDNNFVLRSGVWRLKTSEAMKQLKFFNPAEWRICETETAAQGDKASGTERAFRAFKCQQVKGEMVH